MIITDNVSLKIGKKDIMILSVVFILVLCSFFIWFDNGKNQNGKSTALVKQNGEVLYKVEMKEGVSEKYEIPTDDGKIVVEIDYEKGIRISESTCPNRDCVNTGWVNKIGIPVVCLPNCVEVIISSSHVDSDAVVG